MVTVLEAIILLHLLGFFISSKKLCMRVYTQKEREIRKPAKI